MLNMSFMLKTENGVLVKEVMGDTKGDNKRESIAGFYSTYVIITNSIVLYTNEWVAQEGSVALRGNICHENVKNLCILEFQRWNSGHLSKESLSICLNSSRIVLTEAQS